MPTVAWVMPVSWNDTMHKFNCSDRIFHRNQPALWKKRLCPIYNNIRNKNSRRNSNCDSFFRFRTNTPLIQTSSDSSIRRSGTFKHENEVSTTTSKTGWSFKATPKSDFVLQLLSLQCLPETTALMDRRRMLHWLLRWR